MRNQSNIEDDFLLEEYRRYLLDEMDKEEAEKFEYRLLMEPDLPVEALDEDLLAACARKEFPPEQVRQILHRLTSAPNGPDGALIQGITKLADKDRVRPWAELLPFPLRIWIERHPHTFRTAVAAALLLAVGVPAGIFIPQGEDLPPVVFELALNTVRGSNTIPQLAVPSETERIEIRIDVSGEEYPSYDLVLTDMASKAEVAEQSGVLPETVQGGEVLFLELEASSLPQGEYQLEVSGIKAGSPREILGAPEFEVLQSD
ncbi:MAG TPA: hypothetical protein VMW27_29480 [Thermoanaerobaculia bacterium]|nr:hypothetical protein [Thermoanaerobaculia bacterium]